MEDLQTLALTTQNSQLVLGDNLIALSPYLPDLGNQDPQLLQPIDESDIFLIDLSSITAIAPPRIFTVNNTGDFNDGDLNNGVTTLREAIHAANTTFGKDTINFSLRSDPQTITLVGDGFQITDKVAIAGAGADITISGNQTFRIFEVAEGVAVEISDLTLTDGKANRGGAILNAGTLSLNNTTVRNSKALTTGGGIFNSGTLTVTNSTLNGNTADFAGGGIANEGNLTLRNATVSGNSAQIHGGGISNAGGSLLVESSTIAFNLADNRNFGFGNGGGIFNTFGTATITNSIIARNSDTPNNSGTGAIHADVSGAFIDQGYNLIGNSTGSTGFTVSTLVGNSSNVIDPKISPLQDNGGPTQTHFLFSNSPALNAGDPAIASLTDQRGVVRDASPDIGAYEGAVLNLIVDTLVDENDGDLSAGDVSLREAIAYAADGETIQFTPGLSGPIALNLGEFYINKKLTIDGPGANVLTLSGTGTTGAKSRAFQIALGATVELEGLTIANGSAGQGSGGGIFNDGKLTLLNSMVRNNAGYGGGGIANSFAGDLTILNSTISGNTSSSPTYSHYFAATGGGITNVGKLSITNSTISQNSGMVGGVYNTGTVEINASTIANNNGTGLYSSSGFQNAIGIAKVKNTIIAGSTGSDVFGNVISQGYNLIGKSSAGGFINGVNGDRVGTMAAPLDARLGALQDNGGPTWTHALLSDSPAINAADPNYLLSTDQRGILRVFGGRADIGAFESLTLPPITVIRFPIVMPFPFRAWETLSPLSFSSAGTMEISNLRLF